MRTLFAIGLVLASIYVVFPDLVFARQDMKAVLTCTTATGGRQTIEYKCNVQNEAVCYRAVEDMLRNKYGSAPQMWCYKSLGPQWSYKRLKIEK
jgi:hypothetical protein